MREREPLLRANPGWMVAARVSRFKAPDCMHLPRMCVENTFNTIHTPWQDAVRRRDPVGHRQVCGMHSIGNYLLFFIPVCFYDEDLLAQRKGLLMLRYKKKTIKFC